MRNNSTNMDSTDEAVRFRLARLNQMSVDTSRLEQRLDKALSTPNPSRLRLSPAGLLLAASVVMAATGLLIFSPSQNDATPVIDARQAIDIHERFLSGSDPSFTLASEVGQANQAIAARWPNAPHLPDVPGLAVRGVCIDDMQGTQVSCMHGQFEDQPLTVIVTDIQALRPPPGDQPKSTVSSEVPTFNMVGIERNGQCLCVVSTLPNATLVALLDNIKN